MIKNLLTTGLGMLFLCSALPQNKMSQTLPDAVLMPFSANPPASAGSSIHIGNDLLSAGNKVVGLNESGDTLFLGSVRGHRLHGTWKSWYQGAWYLDSGRLEHSIPDGVWKSWYPNGQLRSIRTYDAFKLGMIKNELRRRHAKNTMYVITDLAKNDPAAAYRLLTPAYSFNNAGPEQHAPVITSLKDRADYNATGNHSAYLPPFSECLHHGLYMNFYPDGATKDSGYYKNGVRDGIWEEWIDDGAIRSSGVYKRGVRRNEWRYFSRDGKLLYLLLYNQQGKVKDRIQLR